jgi:hypothetical protein
VSKIKYKGIKGLVHRYVTCITIIDTTGSSTLVSPQDKV